MSKYNKKGEEVLDLQLDSETKEHGKAEIRIDDRDLKDLMGRILFVLAKIEKHLDDTNDVEIDEDEIEENIRDMMVEVDD